MPVSTAEVLAVRLLNPFAGKPVGNLIITDDHRTGPLGDRDAISHMVTVSMADEDKVCIHCIRGDRSGRISIEEWIDYDFVSISFESKSGVPVPG
jgi:hypothetical protein